MYSCFTPHVPASYTPPQTDGCLHESEEVRVGSGGGRGRDIRLLCIVLMCSLRSQFWAIGSRRQTGSRGVNVTVLFLLHCFANNFGVAMGFLI